MLKTASIHTSCFFEEFSLVNAFIHSFVHVFIERTSTELLLPVRQHGRCWDRKICIACVMQTCVPMVRWPLASISYREGIVREALPTSVT